MLAMWTTAVRASPMKTTSRPLLPFRYPRLFAVSMCIVGWFASRDEAQAQWGHAADLQTPICNIVGASVFDTRVISDGAGGLFAVWRDTRNAATGYDIYAQHLGANGRPQWTANGIEVARVGAIQELPQLV